MARITNQGIVARVLSNPSAYSRDNVLDYNLAGYRELLEERIRNIPIFGNNFSVAPETPQGQIIGIMALALSEADEALVSAMNNLFVETASGVWLDYLGSLLSIRRRPETYTTVSVTVRGTPGTLIRQGWRARTNTGDIFQSTNSAVIPDNGTVNINMRCTVPGPVAVHRGEINYPVDEPQGIARDGVRNNDVGIPGQFVETDNNYRRRLQLASSPAASGSYGALIASLSIEGATHIRIEENATGAVTSPPRQGRTIAAHSIMCIVNGLVPSAIATAIVRGKTLGTGLSGSAIHGGVVYQQAALVPLKITVTTRANDRLFPGNGEAQIKEQIILAAETALSIGEPINIGELIRATSNVIGHNSNISDDNIRQIFSSSKTQLFRWYRTNSATPPLAITGGPDETNPPTDVLLNTPPPVGWSSSPLPLDGAIYNYLYVSTKPRTGGTWSDPIPFDVATINRGTAFPTSPAPEDGDLFQFNANASSITARQTDDAGDLMPVSNAANGDIFRYNGTQWVKLRFQWQLSDDKTNLTYTDDLRLNAPQLQRSLRTEGFTDAAVSVVSNAFQIALGTANTSGITPSDDMFNGGQAINWGLSAYDETTRTFYGGNPTLPLPTSQITIINTPPVNFIPGSDIVATAPIMQQALITAGFTGAQVTVVNDKFQITFQATNQPSSFIFGSAMFNGNGADELGLSNPVTLNDNLVTGYSPSRPASPAISGTQTVIASPSVVSFTLSTGNWNDLSDTDRTAICDGDDQRCPNASQTALWLRYSAADAWQYGLIACYDELYEDSEGKPDLDTLYTLTERNIQISIVT